MRVLILVTLLAVAYAHTAVTNAPTMAPHPTVAPTHAPNSTARPGATQAPGQNVQQNHQWGQQNQWNHQVAACDCSAVRCAAGTSCCCTGTGAQCLQVGDFRCMGNQHPPQPQPQQQSCVCEFECSFGKQCCCTQFGPQCLFANDNRCLAPGIQSVPQVQHHRPHRVGVPSEHTVHVTPFHVHSRKTGRKHPSNVYKYEVNFTSGHLSQDSPMTYTTAILYATSRHVLKHDPYLVLGEHETVVNQRGNRVSSHAVRVRLSKEQAKADRIYYMAGIRLYQRSKDRQSSSSRSSSSSSRSSSSSSASKSSGSSSGSKQKFYNKKLWKEKIHQRRQKRAHRADDAFFDEPRKVSIRNLMRDEDGWTWSHVHSFVPRRPQL